MLRRGTVQKADVLVCACNDPVLREQLGVPVPYTQADASAYIVWCARGWATGEQFTFAVTDPVSLFTRWARTRGLQPIRLYIYPDNRASQRAASKAGYTRTSDDAIVDPEGIDGDLVYITPYA